MFRHPVDPRREVRVGVVAARSELAGFDAVVSDRISTRLHYDTAEEACLAAFPGGPVALAYSRFDDATRAEANAEYVASISPFANGRGYDIPAEFVITIGYKS